MGSSAQVIVGGMLLVVAFLFGKYINDQPIVPTNKSTNSIAAKELPLRVAADLSEPQADLQLPAQPAVVNEPDNSERSLRERILGERKQRQAASNAFKPGLGNGLFQPDEPVFAQKPKQLDSFSSRGKEIAVPDFSYLEASPPPEDLPAVDRPLPRKPQIESFSQFKPIELIEPPKLDFPKSLPSPTEFAPAEFAPDKLASKMPFKNTNDVIVGPIHNRANHTEFNARPPAFPAGPRMSDSRRSDFEPRRSGGAFQTPRASRSLLQPPSPQRERKLEQVSRRDTDSLVPVRHRESRLTTEVQEFFTYKTVFGDTLHGLSTRFFGKPDFYLDIYLANKDKFENPTKMPVNAQLQIPVMAKLINRK